MCMCRLTVISRRDAIRFANTRNMVASSVPLVASAYPPEGFRLMSDADAVRAWLASFRGTIATADYAIVNRDDRCRMRYCRECDVHGG